MAGAEARERRAPRDAPARREMGEGGHGGLVAWEQAQGLPDPYLPPPGKCMFIVPPDGTVPVARWLRLGRRLIHPPPQHLLVLPQDAGPLVHREATPGNLHVALAPGGGYGAQAPAGLQRDGGGNPRLVPLDAVAQSLARVVREAARAKASPEVLQLAAATFAQHILGQEAGQSPAPPGLPLSRGQLQAVTAYIQAHLSGALTLGELAHELNLSPAHFSRRFTAALGMPPMKFVVRMRMARARELVESSNLSMLEVAAETGFPDGAHFSRTFKGYWGLTPSALRRQSPDR